MNTKYFVSRHTGAINWIATQAGWEGAEVVEHFNPAVIKFNDVVAGTLPLHLASEVCARGGKFHFLQIPQIAFGQELTADEMTAMGASVQRFHVHKDADLAEKLSSENKIILVTKHSTTAEWLVGKLADNSTYEVVGDFKADMVGEGDVVVGTLPIHLAHAVQEKGGKFYFLSINHATIASRGKELTASDIEESGAKLMTFNITKVEE